MGTNCLPPAPHHRLTRGACRTFGAVLAWMALVAGRMAWGVTPESPEVRALINEGLEVLEAPINYDRDHNAELLGGKCVVGLAFVKANQPDHPRVAEAVEACRQAMSADRPIDIYSNGLAIVFLTEFDAQRYRGEIQWYLNLLRRRQKEHGGWGYDGNNPDNWVLKTGDTSQTQYAALAYWSAFRHGFSIDVQSLESLAEWLLRTQDPSGVWGYQGKLAPISQRVPQHETGCSMLAAGLGATLICADLLGAVSKQDSSAGALAGEAQQSGEALPPALRAAIEGQQTDEPTPTKLRPTQIDPLDLLEAIDLAQQWMDENYKVDIGMYVYYYLYSTERYQSFYELYQGITEEEPQWYNDGYRFLLENKHEGKGWRGGSGKTVDTAFSVLFLLRSTQKSIQGTLGEGRLVSGRGIPANVASAKLRGNQVVVQQVQTKVDELLSLVDDADRASLGQLARDPTGLVVGEVDERSARRLQQLVRAGEPEVRLLAVRALARTGDLDYVPSLLYALTDPERRIVLEARNGLRFISRRFDGFGLPDDFTDRQRYEAIDAWKEWYKSLRPHALVEL